jgi:hypothetical protein
MIFMRVKTIESQMLAMCCKILHFVDRASCYDSW